MILSIWTFAKKFLFFFLAKQSDLAAQLAAVARKKSPIAGQASGHMTREELERHLEMKTSAKPQFMSIDKAPHSLPDDIFSHDNSNQDR